MYKIISPLIKLKSKLFYFGATKFVFPLMIFIVNHLSKYDFLPLLLHYNVSLLNLTLAHLNYLRTVVDAIETKKIKKKNKMKSASNFHGHCIVLHKTNDSN